MSSASSENLVHLPPEYPRHQDGLINPVFESKDDIGKERGEANEDGSDLGEDFLDNFNLQISDLEIKSEIEFEEKDKQFQRQDKPQKANTEIPNTPGATIQTADSASLRIYVPKSTGLQDCSGVSENRKQNQQKKEQPENELHGEDSSAKAKQHSVSQPLISTVANNKSQLIKSTENSQIGRDYVWSPLFPDVSPPHYALRYNSQGQTLIRQRQPESKFSGKLQVPEVNGINSAKNKKDEVRWHHVTRDAIQAIFVRLLLVCHSFLCVWRAVDVRKDQLYWCLALTNVILVLETIYTVVKRQGRDPKWICPCFVIYLGGTVPALWFLQIDKLDRYNSVVSANVSNLTNSLQEALSSLEGVQIPIYLDPDTWVAILEQILLFVLVVGRMLLPLGDLSREELSQLLFIFIGSGSDVMELFVVFDEPQFRTNSPLKYATLTVWSVSLLQFTFIFTTAKSPKKMRLGTTDDKYHDVKEKRAIFGIEILSLMISFLLMDGPYCALRLYAIIVYNVVSYGIIFFTCKNILMLVLLMYRMFIICIKFRNRGREKKRALREMALHKHALNV